MQRQWAALYIDPLHMRAISANVLHSRQSHLTRWSKDCRKSFQDVAGFVLITWRGEALELMVQVLIIQRLWQFPTAIHQGLILRLTAASILLSLLETAS